MSYYEMYFELYIFARLKLLLFTIQLLNYSSQEILNFSKTKPFYLQYKILNEEKQMHVDHVERFWVLSKLL